MSASFQESFPIVLLFLDGCVLFADLCFNIFPSRFN